MARVYLYIVEGDVGDGPGKPQLEDADFLAEIDAEHLLEIVKRGIDKIAQRVDTEYQKGISKCDSADWTIGQLVRFYQHHLTELEDLATCHADGEALRTTLFERIHGKEIPF